MRFVGALLVLLLLVGGAAWLYRDSLPFLGDSEPVEVSPEAAEQAAEKLERLRSEGEEIRLNSVEVSSLLRYRGSEWTPTVIRDPDVRMSGDTLVVAATIPTERIPSHPDLDRVRGLLPDSGRVELEGSLRMLDDGRVALAVEQVEFAGIPIPERYYAPMLERLGRSDEPGLAPDEMALTLPEGVSEVRVEEGYLILVP
ncbi:MAG TPA: hypothetical protein VF167_13285 [Longimicrobiaceae bacterium]